MILSQIAIWVSLTSNNQIGALIFGVLNSFMSDYRELQDTIDKVIGLIGLAETKSLLNSFIGNIPLKDEHEKKLIVPYIISVSIEVFQLNEKEFLICNESDYRDARYCCFHLMHKYTHSTFSKIARIFNHSDRQVSYGYKVAEERLAIPRFHTEFVTNYKRIESNLARVLAKMS